MEKLIPVPSEVLTFIKKQHPHCTSQLIKQFIRQRYDKNFSTKRNWSFINKLVAAGQILRDKKDKDKIIFLGE